jgi:hypothetical protein
MAEIHGRRVTAVVQYVPVQDLNTIKLKESWRLRINKSELDVEKLSPYACDPIGSESPFNECVLSWTLATAPPAKQTITISLIAGQEGEQKVGSVTNKKVPMPTKKDPTGKADFYGSFSLTKPKDKGLVLGIDIRAKRVFVRRALGDSTYLDWKPNFSVKAFSDVLDDEDSLKLATDFIISRRWSGNLVDSFATTASPLLEADRDFVNTNLLIDLNERFYLFPQRRIQFTFMLGAEIGKSLRSEIAEVEGDRRARIKLGFDLKYEREFKPASPIGAVGLEVNYVHRALFDEEVRSTTASVTLKDVTIKPEEGEPFIVKEGKFTYATVASIDKESRPYVNAKFSLRFTPFIEYFASYTYGSLPPKFKEVNRFQIGVAFRYFWVQ